MNNGDEPITADKKFQDPKDGHYYNVVGLTKREHFAGLAMQGLLSGDIEDNLTIGHIATCSVEIADALLKEINK